MGVLQWNEKELQIIERAMAELEAKSNAIDVFVPFDKVTWSVEQKEGTIVFSRPDDIKAVAPVQIIGTYNPVDGTWLWAWDHPSVLVALASNAAVVRAYGEDHAIASLTTRKIACDESDCLQLTALACKLCNAQGAFCGRSGDTRIYMTFGQIRLSCHGPGSLDSGKAGD